MRLKELIDISLIYFFSLNINLLNELYHRWIVKLYDYIINYKNLL